MALDVYVGSLTRYYAGEWENHAGRVARRRGAPRPVVRPSGPLALEDRESLHPAVMAWRKALAQSMGDRVTASLDWDETPAAPYFTGRPGWDGFGSLVLWAAYAEHPTLRCPATLPEEWDNDLALMRSNAGGFRSRYAHLVGNVELWLPLDVELTFEGEDVGGRRVVMGSAATLRRQLAELNGVTWKAGGAAVAVWASEPPAEETSLELRARYAFSVLFGLAGQAVGHRLPMKLDY